MYGFKYSGFLEECKGRWRGIIGHRKYKPDHTISSPVSLVSYTCLPHVEKTGVRFYEHLFFVDFYNLRKLVLPVLCDFSHLTIDFAYIGAILPHIKKKCYLFFTNFFVKIGDYRIKLERRKDFEGQICGQNPAEFDKNIRIGGKIRRDCLGSDSWSYTSKSLVFQILFCRFRRL